MIRTFVSVSHSYSLHQVIAVWFDIANVATLRCVPLDALFIIDANDWMSVGLISNLEDIDKFSRTTLPVFSNFEHYSSVMNCL